MSLSNLILIFVWKTSCILGNRSLPSGSRRIAALLAPSGKMSTLTASFAIRQTAAIRRFQGAERRLAHCSSTPFGLNPNRKGDHMRGALLWMIGIPLPVVILLYLFHVI
jgi:hypothetical protein